MELFMVTPTGADSSRPELLENGFAPFLLNGPLTSRTSKRAQRSLKAPEVMI